MVKKRVQRILVILLSLSIIGANTQIVGATEVNTESTDNKNEEIIEGEENVDREDGISKDENEQIEDSSNIQVEQEDSKINIGAQTTDDLEDLKVEEDDPENGDRANSWRYKEGELIPQRIRYTQYSTWPTNIPGAVAHGIDVSEHQGTINWAQVKKSGVDYAIIRCGYGMDQTDQDDKNWYTNADACIKNGIPFGTYLYSYADSVERAKSEAQHVLRLVKGYNLSYPIYYDLEESSVREKLSTTEIANIAQAFCDIIEDAGYEVAIYANTDWFTNYLTNNKFSQWDKWVAQYNTICTYKGDYSMWQCSSQGRVNGISGYVDLNIDLGAALEPPVRLVTENGKTYCYQGDTQLFGEQKVDGHWYYFDKDKKGEMVKGWYTLSVKTGGTKTVYYDTNGWMVYGEKKIDGHWYYFNPVTGARTTGWCEVSMKSGGTKIVYYDTKGWMVYGEKEIDGYNYYFDLVTGARTEGWREIEAGQEVYYDEEGRLVYGEKKIDGHWYYFDTGTGYKLTGWQEVSVKTGGMKTVYYDENGRMVYGEKKIDGHWYYFNQITGARTSGWHEVPVKTGGTKTVYYDTNGWMVYGEKEIDGYNYYFNPVTGARTEGWRSIKDGKEVYYDEKGRLVYGEKKIDGHWYCFDTSTGYKLTGWQEVAVKAGGSKMVYYGTNGWMVYGEKKIDGYWYYFNPVTGARTTGWCEVPVKTGGTKTVYYDINGQMVYGEKKIGGDWYYFDKITGKMVKNVTINGYHYGNDGKRAN